MYATWCGPCKMQSPIIDKIADEQGENIKVAKIDIDEAPEIAEKYGVMSIPTLLIIKNGEVAKQFVGLTKKEDIEASL
jgi:thioredoxin 1